MFARILHALACVLLLLAPALQAQTPARKVLLLTEEPYASATLLANKYQSLLAYLQRNGLDCAYLKARDYAHYVQLAREQQIDIAFASSGLASLLSERFGYTPLLASDNTLSATVFVSTRSNVQTPQQLDNTSILAPEPYDIVYEMAHRLIAARGMEQMLMPHVVQTPKVDKIILSIMRGEHDAGIVANFDIALVKPELRRMVRVIDQSDSVTAHYLLLRKTVPDAQRQQLVKAMLAFHTSDEGSVYANDFGSSRFVPFADAHERELHAFRDFGEFIGNVRPAAR